MARHWLQRPVSRGVPGQAQSRAGVPVTARSDSVPDVRRCRRARGAGVLSRQALGQVLTMVTPTPNARSVLRSEVWGSLLPAVGLREHSPRAGTARGAPGDGAGGSVFREQEWRAPPQVQAEDRRLCRVGWGAGSGVGCDDGHRCWGPGRGFGRRDPPGPALASTHPWPAREQPLQS